MNEFDRNLAECRVNGHQVVKWPPMWVGLSKQVVLETCSHCGLSPERLRQEVYFTVEPAPFAG